MQSDSFELTSPDTPSGLRADSAWPSAILFETIEEIYQRVYRALKPRSPLPKVEVRFEKFVNADSFIRFENGKISVRISDLLDGAPSPVLESLAFILLSKLFRKQVAPTHSHRYRLFLNRRDMRTRAQQARRERGRKLILDPKGAIYDLVEVYGQVNSAYFHGLMAQPLLGWSIRVSRTRLGHYDPSHNAIVISRIFDRAETPRLALEYVMFHEMLHLRFPVDHSRARRCVHTREFKAAEREFKEFEKAKQLLKTL